MTKFFQYLEKAIDAFAEVAVYFVGMTVVGISWYLISWSAWLMSYVCLFPAKVAVYAIDAFVKGG